MHAMTMLHRLLSKSCPYIHKKRLESLCAVTGAAVSGAALTLSDLGRGLASRASMKHNIKRVDRLLGNEALDQELPQLYQALAQHHLAHLKNPVIIVDWSDLTPDGRWQLLRASIAFEGRSVTLYEQVHPQRYSGAWRVHQQFLARLASILPPGCTPILVTDAGFRGAWFKLVNQMGWHWIGRIRNRDMVKRVGGQTWSGCKNLYPGATETPRCLGQFDYVRSNPVPCRLVIVKHRRKGRHKRSVLGKPAHSYHSRKNARRQREPWLLAVSPGLEHLSANAVVNVYAKRMQIEEEFRDLKNEHFGLGFSANRSKHGKRFGVLLLVACLASFLLRLIGEIAHAHHVERQCQSNTRRSRAVLSCINLARQLAGKGLLVFPYYEFMAALRLLCRRFRVQEV
jgi:hypothetical protein